MPAARELGGESAWGKACGFFGKLADYELHYRPEKPNRAARAVAGAGVAAERWERHKLQHGVWTTADGGAAGNSEGGVLPCAGPALLITGISNDPTGCVKRSGHHHNAGDAGAPDRWLPGRVRGDSPPRGGGGVARVLRHGGAGSRPGAKPGKCALRRPDLKANFFQPFGQYTAYWTKHSVTTHPNPKAFNAPVH